MSVRAIFSKDPTGREISVGMFVDSADGKVAIFEQSRNHHHFHQRDAWGIDDDAFQDLTELGCERIEIEIYDGGKQKKKISTSFKHFAEASWLYTFPGFCARRFLEERKWTQDSVSQLEMKL